jgi:hypothetical protein
VLDDDWHPGGHDSHHPLPLPADVDCYAIAATMVNPREDEPAVELISKARRHLTGLRGDGLVPIASALGRHRDLQLTLAFAPEQQAIAWDSGHLDLLSSAAVYTQLRAWLAAWPGADGRSAVVEPMAAAGQP